MNDISFTSRRTRNVSASDDVLELDPFEHASPAPLTPFEIVQEGTEEASVTPAPNQRANDGTETNAPSRTRTMVVSEVAGMAEMVALGLAKDDGLEVSHKRVALSDLVADQDVDLDAIDLIVFQVRTGNDADLKTLRDLKSKRGAALKVLGVSSEMLSLATARALMDAGVDEVMPLTSMQPSSAHADQVEAAVDPAQAIQAGVTRNAVIVAVAGARGGIGTTAFALNLATVLARRAHKKDTGPLPRVAVVDFDFQNGVLGASIDIHDGGAYLELLKGEVEPDQTFVKRALVPYDDGGFDVLSAPASIAPLDALTPGMVATLLDELRLAYDYVVLDLPRSLVDWVDPVLVRADRLYILGDTTVHTVRQMRRMIDLYADDHAALPIDLVVSKQTRPFIPGADIKEAETFLERKLEFWVPDDSRSAKRANDKGRPILHERPKSPIAKAMAPAIGVLREMQASTTRRRA